MINENSLFYTCSLIEYIGRKQKLERSTVVINLGKNKLAHIYDFADVFHCELIEKVAYDFIMECKIPKGNFDNVKQCKYTIPDYWDIGAVYARLIEDVYKNSNDAVTSSIIDVLYTVYTSWMNNELSFYNSHVYWQPRDYIYECYRSGEIIYE